MVRLERGFVPGGAAPDLDEGVLHQLFGFGVIAKHPAGDSEGPRGEALIELGERALISADDAVEEALVVDFAQAGLLRRGLDFTEALQASMSALTDAHTQPIPSNATKWCSVPGAMSWNSPRQTSTPVESR